MGVAFGLVGLLYGVLMMLSIAPAVWTPFIEMHAEALQMRQPDRGFSLWPSSLWPHAYIFAFTTVVGLEFMLFIGAIVISLVMIQPLAKNVWIAAEGTTVLETMFPIESLDKAALPDGRKAYFA